MCRFLPATHRWSSQLNILDLYFTSLLQYPFFPTSNFPTQCSSTWDPQICAQSFPWPSLEILTRCTRNAFLATWSVEKPVVEQIWEPQAPASETWMWGQIPAEILQPSGAGPCVRWVKIISESESRLATQQTPKGAVVSRALVCGCLPLQKVTHGETTSAGLGIHDGHFAEI